MRKKRETNRKQGKRWRQNNDGDKGGGRQTETISSALDIEINENFEI